MPKSKHFLSRSGLYVDLYETPTSLQLVPTKEGKIEAARLADDSKGTDNDLHDLLEDHLGNGWEWVEPSEVGAMTEAPILSSNVLRNDDNDVVYVGIMYWHANYMVQDPIALLARGKAVTFQREGKAIPGRVLREYDELRDLESTGHRVDWKPFIKKWSS